MAVNGDRCELEWRQFFHYLCNKCRFRAKCMIVQHKKQWIIIRLCATTTKMLKLLEEQFFVKLSIFWSLNKWLQQDRSIQAARISGISKCRWNEITRGTFCTLNCYILPLFPSHCCKKLFWPFGHRILIGFRTVGGTAVAQWLRCSATNRKVTGSIPDGVIGIFH